MSLAVMVPTKTKKIFGTKIIKGVLVVVEFNSRRLNFLSLFQGDLGIIGNDKEI